MPSVTLVSPRGGSVVVSELGDLEHYLRRNWAPQSGSAEEARASFTGRTTRPDALESHPASSASLAFAGVMATLRRGQRSSCIGVIGDSTGDGTNQGVGSVDEWPQVLVKKLGADFPAYTVREQRWNDATQGYDPAIVHQTGTADGGSERRAVFAKAAPGSMRYDSTALTGDQDIRVRVSPTTWTPTGDQTLVARWEATTSSRALLLVLKTTGALGLNWSTNGTAGFGEKVSTATIPATANPGSGNPLWLRAVLDVDNGATGNDVKFYYSADGVAWTQLGATVTTAGVTSVFGGTAPYQVGAFSSGLSNPYDGAVHRVSIRSVIDGQTSIVPDLLDDWDWYSPETTVSFAGAPVLTLLNGSASGKNIAYFDDPTRRVIVHQPRGQAVLLVSSGHNDVTQSRRLWLANYNSLITNIKGLLPYVPILCFAQNQTGSGGAFTITTQGRELRAARGAILAQYAASQTGCYFFDAWPLVPATDTIDQLHPTTGPGSGSDKWGSGLYRAIA